MQDRLILGWMETFQDYPLAELKAACNAAALDSPKTMPSRALVRDKLMKARAVAVAAHKAKAIPAPPPELRKNPDKAARVALASTLVKSFARQACDD